MANQEIHNHTGEGLCQICDYCIQCAKSIYECQCMCDYCGGQIHHECTCGRLTEEDFEMPKCEDCGSTETVSESSYSIPGRSVSCKNCGKHHYFEEYDLSHFA